MDKLCFGVVTAITALICLDTLRRLYVDRHRFSKEDLNDYDLAFVWRIVIFLIYPLLNLFSLWVSVIVCQWCGGYVKSLSYGLLWYQVIPDELASKSYLMPSLFAGEIAQTALVIMLLPALLFRPHPFLAMLITYSCTFVLSINLIVDPLLSTFGFGSAHWQIALSQGTKGELGMVVLIHLIFAIIFLALITNETVQKLFAELIRPIAMDKLKKALAENKDKSDLVTLCNLVLLYEAAGLSKQANKKLAQIKRDNPKSLLSEFTQAYLSYRRRNYKQALKLFLTLADSHLRISNELKSMFLAAAACSAHANHDYVTSLNLIDRALEFDYHCSMARMIKIDILLKQGREEKAAEEFQAATYGGFDKVIEQAVPIDWQKALAAITDVDTCNEEPSQSTNASN